MPQNQMKRNQRLADWGNSYLESTKESYRRAENFCYCEDWFTAYLYLFVAFNNLYTLVAGFERGNEAKKIRAAIHCIPNEGIVSIYTAEYIGYLNELNGRTPEQFQRVPDGGTAHCGIVNMQKYFLGKEPEDCIVHLFSEIAHEGASAAEKKQTIEDLAACLLYTVRNNQFHAVKGAEIPMDERVLCLAYKLLEPVVKALLTIGSQQIEATKQR